MTEPLAWTYVDEARTHRVETGLRRGRTLEYVIRETAIGCDDPEEAYEEVHALLEQWESRAHQLALETRLHLLGRYHRSAGAGWHPLRAPIAHVLDLEPLEVSDGSGSIEFHHYRAREGEHAVTLVAVHEELSRGTRTFLARLDYDYPQVDGGNLQVLHPRLPPPLFRSALASQHLELRELGFQKHSRGASAMMEPRAWTALRAVLETILVRLVEGRLEREGEAKAPTRGEPDPLRALEARVLARRAQNAASAAGPSYALEDEIGPGNAPVAGRAPALLMEELPTDIVKALEEPRLVALHARYLGPGEEARLMEEGELAILRAMRAKRDAVEPHDRHLVSLLEASLLLRRALRKRTPVDRDVITRVRHARAYL